MSWKFNPPPGWPEQPEGWQPPPGWTPDPSWPPAPAGWQFWVPATSTPEPPTTGPGSPATGPGSPATGSGSPAAGSGSPAAPERPTVHEAPTSVGGTHQVSPHSGSGYAGAGQPTAPYQTSPSASGAPSAGYAPGSAGAPPYQPGPHPPAPHQPGPYPPGPYPPALGAPAAGKPWHQQWWAIGGTALAVLLVGCLGGTAVALVTDSGDDSPGSPDPPANTASPSESPDETGGESSGSGGLPVGEERSGEGPTIIPLDLPEDSLHTITLTFSGEGSFAAQLVDDRGDAAGSLGSSNGDYSGVYPVEVGKYGAPDALDITEAGDGSWTVLVEDLAEAPLWPEVTEGTGDVVLQIDPAYNDAAVVGSHDGSSQFIVWAHSEVGYEDRLLFNEIGDFSGDGQDEVVPESALIHVQADGNWTLEPA